MNKNLVDTSGWLDYFTNGENADFFAPAIEDTSNLIVSVINIYELFKRVIVEPDFLWFLSTDQYELYKFQLIYLSLFCRKK